MDQSAKAAKLSDTATLARFIANPKAVAGELGIDTEDADTARDLEKLARAGQGSIRALAGSVGLASREVEAADWGIGAGCCNSLDLAVGRVKAARR